MEPNIDDFRSYHFDQVRALANLIVDAEDSCVATDEDVGALRCLLRDKVNEAAEYLDKIICDESCRNSGTVNGLGSARRKGISLIPCPFSTQGESEGLLWE